MNKKVKNAAVALEGVTHKMTLMLGGFGLCGIPENAISELVNKEIGGLPVYQIMLELMILGLVCF